MVTHGCYPARMACSNPTTLAVRTGPANAPFRNAVRVTISNEIITPSQCGNPPPSIGCQEVVPGRLQCDVSVLRTGWAAQNIDDPIYISAFHTIQMQFAHSDVWLEWLGAPRYGTLYEIGDQAVFHLDVPLYSRLPPNPTFRFAPDFLIEIWSPATIGDGATYPSLLNITAWVAQPCG